jgi:hypothetical protein
LGQPKSRVGTARLGLSEASQLSGGVGGGT